MATPAARGERALGSVSHFGLCLGVAAQECRDVGVIVGRPQCGTDHLLGVTHSKRVSNVVEELGRAPQMVGRQVRMPNVRDDLFRCPHHRHVELYDRGQERLPRHIAEPVLRFKFFVLGLGGCELEEH